MAYIPRRRLVLANARSAGVHTQWSSSQMPWDAEEEAFAADDQQSCANFEAACFTQESALTENQGSYWGSQPDHQLHYYVDSRATEQAPSSLHNMPSCEPASSLQQQCSHAAARDQFTLPQEEYRDIYNFLTKGTGQVQEMSSVERALFKLANLRQVGAYSVCCLVFASKNKCSCQCADHEVAWCDTRWQDQAGAQTTIPPKRLYARQSSTWHV